VKLVPLPVVQWLPPSVLYCQFATSDAKVTSTWPLLVMRSLPLEPVSACSAAPGAATVVSSVTVSAAVLGVPILPATSTGDLADLRAVGAGRQPLRRQLQPRRDRGLYRQHAGAGGAAVHHERL
jgi:hypothetical protein